MSILTKVSWGLVAICALVVVAVSFAVLGYQKGLNDSAVVLYFNDAGRNWAHLKILRENGPDELIDFVEKDLESAISLHRSALGQQSWLSPLIGPLKERTKTSSHHLKYYRSILEYKLQHPGEEQVIEDLSWLIEQVSLNRPL